MQRPDWLVNIEDKKSNNRPNKDKQEVYMFLTNKMFTYANIINGNIIAKFYDNLT